MTNRPTDRMGNPNTEDGRMGNNSGNSFTAPRDEMFDTMECSTHGAVEILKPMPGSGYYCPKCSAEQWERERINAEGLHPIRQQLDRIEKPAVSARQSMSAIRLPDGTVIVGGDVRVSADLILQGKAAVLERVVEDFLAMANRSLDNIEDMPWATCGMCGRTDAPGNTHAECEARCEAIRNR